MLILEEPMQESGKGPCPHVLVYGYTMSVRSGIESSANHPCPYKLTLEEPIARKWKGTLPTCVGLAKTVYIRFCTPYIWWYPSQKYRMYTVYMVLANPTHMLVYGCTMSLECDKDNSADQPCPYKLILREPLTRKWKGTLPTCAGGGDSQHFRPMCLLFLYWCRECFAACVVFLFFLCWFMGTACHWNVIRTIAQLTPACPNVQISGCYVSRKCYA